MSLSTCSERVKSAINWLEDRVKYDEEKIKKKLNDVNEKIKKIEDKKSIPYILIKNKSILESRIKTKYIGSDIEKYYVLSKVNSPIINDVIIATNDDLFWSDSDHIPFEQPYKIRYFLELGLGDNKYVKEWISEIVKNQTIEGALSYNSEEHTGSMWALSKILPESLLLKNAIDWWLENWDTYKDELTVPFAILSLIELDIEKYKDDIMIHIEYLKTLQNEEGYWAKYDSEGWNYINTCFSIYSISKLLGEEDEAVKNGVEWLVKNQESNGSWMNDEDYTSIAILALLSVGEGPKIPVEYAELEYVRYEQKLKKQKPFFLHTSPIYKKSMHVKEIYDKIFEMLKNAKKEIRISSLYIDILYEEIINITKENSDIVIKVITRPKRDIKGIRERIAKNVIDLINIASRGNVVLTDVVHSRLIIIDDKELLVTSADLTRDQLFDEYNAGIWISDRETIKKAIDFFDNVYEMEKEN